MRRIISPGLLLLFAVATPLAAGDNVSVRASRVIMRVADLEASIAFYRDRVGLPLQTTFDEFAVFGNDGVTLMLQQIERTSNSPNAGLSALTEVVLESPDVMKSYREMKERGVVFLREPFAATTDGSRVLYAAGFRDPDGHELAITGWVNQ